MTRDVVGELSQMMSKEKRKAFDAGVIAAIDMVITLCEISGGRLNTKQLNDFKQYTNGQLNEREIHDRETQEFDGQGNEDSTQDTPSIQSGWRTSEAGGVQFFGPGTSDQSEGEAASPSTREASEAGTQAEQA